MHMVCSVLSGKGYVIICEDSCDVFLDIYYGFDSASNSQYMSDIDMKQNTTKPNHRVHNSWDEVYFYI